MNIIKNLKGYWKRLTTPKPNSTYVPADTSYGEIQVVYVDAIQIKYDVDVFTQITLRIIIDNDQKDTKKDIAQLQNICCLNQIQLVQLNQNEYIIQASVDYYLKLFFNNEQLRRDNKIFGSIYSTAKQINILFHRMDWEFFYQSNPTKQYCPYIVPTTNTPLPYIYSPLKDATCAWIYVAIGDELVDLSIESFLTKYALDAYFRQDILEIERNKPGSFMLPNGINILDINKQVNSDMSSYDDIDEVL